ncbi:hypothetical protein A2V56_04560 [Candidatus Woesebacteria bacterium RBG_19FT_COMBO_42_9]|uniref:Uncharacterized protein n=1 Tax=Candidatus Woesebacteria bacterium RBG_16_42_24 TaxID=1802485 RepID=A0A1F7XP17_9BACT|nr:MAG: hypothetical protein A2V97_04540 [Candidatus Woesebacteria bacterium RBG_16_42_24]OGM16233.1 MAG: hypothetical protein A2V56_04560 [Candidatus Woesebacteria bacterium RBG_19FT_COMBO_42_9]OGM66319.1 MAG: hypothetical protein A2985_03910 [Candidatus Woesebacteria bacterium RIFCSPLOWO2_01_FULL_43_11]
MASKERREPRIPGGGKHPHHVEAGENEGTKADDESAYDKNEPSGPRDPPLSGFVLNRTSPTDNGVGG